MSTLDQRQMLLGVFMRLRRSGVTLGIGEFVAAMQALEGGWGRTNEQLKQLARLLWCHSPEELRELETIWADALAGEALDDKHSTTSANARPLTSPRERRADAESSLLADSTADEQPHVPDWKPFPVRAPFTPAQTEDTTALDTYWPVSRRYMAYTWAYLRRPLPDGPPDILDVAATVDNVTRQGFFFAPVYRRRDRNHAHLVLLLDQGGSMMPFHHFTRDLVETARNESTIEHVDVFYFHNAPSEQLYQDSFLTVPVPLTNILAQCSVDTSVLIVSDGGAARGYRRLDRIRTTTDFLLKLKQQTALCAWLNPMPEERWTSTSASILAHLVPMFQMDPDGFSNAIDVVRGQPFQHQR